jgi:hypothetical protein
MSLNQDELKNEEYLQVNKLSTAGFCTIVGDGSRAGCGTHSSWFIENQVVHGVSGSQNTWNNDNKSGGRRRIGNKSTRETGIRSDIADSDIGTNVYGCFQ